MVPTVLLRYLQAGAGGLPCFERPRMKDSTTLGSPGDHLPTPNFSPSWELHPLPSCALRAPPLLQEAPPFISLSQSSFWLVSSGF
jgi:hypothetical protein